MGQVRKFGFALCLLAATATAQAAEPRSAEVLLEYQKGLPQIMPQFAKAYGKYLGSGSGSAASQTMLWSWQGSPVDRAPNSNLTSLET